MSSLLLVASGLGLLLVAALGASNIPHYRLFLQGLAALSGFLGGMLVLMGIGTALELPTVTLTIEESRLCGNAAVVKFVGETERRILTFRNGERLPDLRPGAHLRVRKSRFSTDYCYSR
jgi:hypothetical protein